MKHGTKAAVLKGSDKKRDEDVRKQLKVKPLKNEIEEKKLKWTTANRLK